MLNKAIIMGRLTRDPEMRYTQNNTAVCSFTVAVDRNYVPQGGQKQTDFLNVTAWRSTAEFIGKYFTKGRMIVVVGSIQTRTWEGQDGKKNYATDIVADEVFFDESKQEGEPSQSTAYYPAAPSGAYSPASSYAPAAGREDTGAPPPAVSHAPNMGEADFVSAEFIPLDTDDDLPF